MTDQTVPVVTLVTLADGAASELFQGELYKVLRNINDPNTDPRAVRKITLEVTFRPDKHREMGEIKVSARSKLPANLGAETKVYFGNHRGELIATEYNPKQAGLFDERPPALRAVGGDGEGAKA